jgi:protease I
MKKVKPRMQSVREQELAEVMPISTERPMSETGRDEWVDILSKKDFARRDTTAPKKHKKVTSSNIKAAILTEEGFEEIELTSPKHALESEGVQVDVISPRKGKVKGWDKTKWGKEVEVNVPLSNASASDYDLLVLPGGVMNPDKLRQNKDAISFIMEFIRSGKPIAAICHGPQVLIETGMIAGTTMTSYPSLQTDLRNAGVNWVDSEVVHYGQFITSRKPADLVAFNRELINALPLR